MTSTVRYISSDQVGSRSGPAKKHNTIRYGTRRKEGVCVPDERAEQPGTTKCVEHTPHALLGMRSFFSKTSQREAYTKTDVDIDRRDQGCKIRKWKRGGASQAKAVCVVLLHGRYVVRSLHSLALAHFVGLVFVCPLLGICRVEEGMYI